jgi:hypothetical protein
MGIARGQTRVLCLVFVMVLVQEGRTSTAAVCTRQNVWMQKTLQIQTIPCTKLQVLLFACSIILFLCPSRSDQDKLGGHSRSLISLAVDVGVLSPILCAVSGAEARDGGSMDESRLLRLRCGRLWWVS